MKFNIDFFLKPYEKTYLPLQLLKNALALIKNIFFKLKRESFT